LANSLKFRPKARIIRTIGDQLISGPEAAVIELVKNSYDADASYVRVKFIPPLNKGEGRIIVTDDGHGMSLEDIHNKWMEPATTSKAKLRKSPMGRTLLGSKGIGRFAASKLGRFMALNSTTLVGDSIKEVIIPGIDWSIFNEDTYLSDISIEYIEEDADSPSGTIIEISCLNETWTADKIHRLHVELKRLISPISAEADKPCSIFLDLSEFTEDLAGFDGYRLFSDAASIEDADHGFEITPFPLLTACDYEVSGTFDSEGEFRGEITIHRGNQSPTSLSLSVPIDEEEDNCGELSVHFYIFDREGQTLKSTMRKAGMGEVTIKKAREILDEVCGVSIYKNDFRIRPYGDPENDWLTLDKRRVQNPSLRIGHNQVAGYVTVQGEETSGLLERSSREGFEENSNFSRLQRLILTLLTKEIEPRRYVFREKAGIGRRKGTTFPELRKLAELKKIKKFLSILPKEDREEAEAIIDSEAAELSQKITALEERQVILEAKSSLGLILGEVLHEGTPSASFIYKTSGKLAVWHKKMFKEDAEGRDIRKQLPSKLRLMQKNAERLSTLFRSLKPLAGGKRGGVKHFNPINVALEARAIFEEHGVDINVKDRGGSCPEIIGYPQDLTAALVNLLVNSIFWLEESETENPEINIRFDSDESHVRIFVEDNGPGIPDEFADQIFDIGFSLKDDGTGLGLNIANEAISRSGGSLQYHPSFKEGARFELCLGR